VHEQGNSPEAGGAWLLDRTDAVAILGLMLVGLGLRLLYFSGYGLGDDVLFRHFIHGIVSNKTVQPDNFSYRATWWFPTAFAARLLGLNEFSLVLPITIAATLGIGVVYALGKALWGRPGAVIAALLLIVHPFDFAWSTMLANDAFTSLFSALCILFVLRALEPASARARRRLWILAGVSLWLAYHAKVTAVALLPAIAVTVWIYRERLDRQVLYFLVTAGALLGFSHLAFYVLTGHANWPYYAETTFQGLAGDEAAKFHRLTWDVFWVYPRLLFYPNAYGNWMFSVHPHLLVGFLLAGWALGLRTSLAVLAWFLFMFLAMQFNIQYTKGVWVAGFRNVRHIHVFVYPLVLLLTGYLVGLRQRFPRFTLGAVALLLAFGGWQSVSTATKTAVSFEDRRQACHFLAQLPPKPVYSDFQIETWCSIIPLEQPEWTFRTFHGFDRQIQKTEIASIQSGYLVTGGGREPYYGCIDCVPLANAVDPARWRLLKEFPGPTEPTLWREEQVRVWERTEDAVSR
jgi:hypothetical protein